MQDDGEVIRVGVRCRTAGARCPGCGSWSGRVHGSYLRFPADLPVAGRRVVLRLRVRRFTCEDVSCGRRTFVEQVAGLQAGAVRAERAALHARGADEDPDPVPPLRHGGPQQPVGGLRLGLRVPPNFLRPRVWAPRRRQALQAPRGGMPGPVELQDVRSARPAPPATPSAASTPAAACSGRGRRRETCRSSRSVRATGTESLRWRRTARPGCLPHPVRGDRRPVHSRRHLVLPRRGAPRDPCLDSERLSRSRYERAEPGRPHGHDAELTGAPSECPTDQPSVGRPLVPSEGGTSRHSASRNGRCSGRTNGRDVTGGLDPEF